MSNNVKALIIAAVVASLGVVAIVVLGGSNNKVEIPTTTNQTPTASSTNATKCVSSTPAATVTYIDSGFQPALSSIKVNESIKFINNSNAQLQLDSDPHPVHTDEPELNVGVIGNDESCTITLTRTGTWGFHNHLNSAHQASVEVK